MVLTELANRARITRRPFDNDPALGLHSPGVQLSAGRQRRARRHPLTWTVSEFAALLLQRATVIAGLLNDAEQRGKLLELADHIWDHLAARRLDGGRGRNLWDQPSKVFGQLTIELRRSRPGTTPNASWRGWSPRPTCSSRPPLRSQRLADYGARPAQRGRAPLRPRAADRRRRGAGRACARRCSIARVNLQRAREIVQRPAGHGRHAGQHRPDRARRARRRPARRERGGLRCCLRDLRQGRHRPVGDQQQRALPQRAAGQRRLLPRLRLRLADRRRDLRHPGDGARHHGRRPALLPARRGRRPARASTSGRSPTAPACADRPPGAGRLVLLPGDSGGGEFPRHRRARSSAAPPVPAAGRGVRPLPGRPQRRPVVRHRDGARGDGAAGAARRPHPLAGLPPLDPPARHRRGRPGLRRAGHPRHRRASAATTSAELADALRFVRTAVVDPDSPELAGPAARRRWPGCATATATWPSWPAGARSAGRSLLGDVPLDPVLQWREQLISDNDVWSRRIANRETLEAFDSLAKKIVDDAAWETL